MIDKALVQQQQAKAKRVTERRKRMLERDAVEMVSDKLKKVNEPGETVKCVPLDCWCWNGRYSGHSRDLARLLEKCHNTHIQLALRPARVITLCFNLCLSFWINNVLTLTKLSLLMLYTGLPSFEILHKTFSTGFVKISRICHGISEVETRCSSSWSCLSFRNFNFSSFSNFVKMDDGHGCSCSPSF